MASNDVVILGAGGAGLMCGIEAGRRGRSVIVVDHSEKVGGKILISGGGRCNFTNLSVAPKNYVSENEHFCKSAFARFTPQDFIQRVESHKIPYHEKTLGQLFCDDSAKRIVEMLKEDCQSAGVQIRTGCKVKGVKKHHGVFQVDTEAEVLEAESLVVATGGLSLPKLGATGIGYEIAKQFGLKLVERAPALDGFVLGPQDADLAQLAGVAVDCEVSCRGSLFREALLFTHRGLSGPVALQASLHWRPGSMIEINLSPDQHLFEWFREKKAQGSRMQVKNILSDLIPARVAEWLCSKYFESTEPLISVSEKELKKFCDRLHSWKLQPQGTVGYSKAEVTRGGVDTVELSSKTMESKKVPGLYFIGEVVDVTGWLGGYNFQWAWSSGWCAGQVV